MSPELDKKLCEKYPLIFRDRNGDMMQTAMCWGFECDDGWYNILDALCLSIQSYINNHNDRIEWNKNFNAKLDRAKENNFIDWPSGRSREYREIGEPIAQVVARQVKEKFGGLRFYIAYGDDVIYALIYMAETLSLKTCEVCGKPGKLNNGPWFKTVCEEHSIG